MVYGLASSTYSKVFSERKNIFFAHLVLSRWLTWTFILGIRKTGKVNSQKRSFFWTCPCLDSTMLLLLQTWRGQYFNFYAMRIKLMWTHNLTRWWIIFGSVFFIVFVVFQTHYFFNRMTMLSYHIFLLTREGSREPGTIHVSSFAKNSLHFFDIALRSHFGGHHP